MSQYRSMPVIGNSISSRDDFIRNTYLHLLFAAISLVSLEYVFYSSSFAMRILSVTKQINWLVLVALSITMSLLTYRFAQLSRPKFVQYFSFFAYIFVQSMILFPLIYQVNMHFGRQLVDTVMTTTILGYSCLALIGLAMKADFTWLGRMMVWAFFSGLILIVTGAFFGFDLATYLSVGIIVLAGISILTETSQMIHHYTEDDYVSAALQLFAIKTFSIWFVFKLFSSRR